MIRFIILIFLALFFISIKCDYECSKTICNPRAGDLLIGRESLLKASSTCGLNNIERFCVVTLTDRGGDPKCSVCYSKDRYNPFSSPNSHRIENVVSKLPRDNGRWWQSTNGIHNISIEVAFESEFQFIFTQLRFKTYRPAAMYIERSKDYGLTWQKSAYFSDNCARDFPTVPERKRYDIGEVSCTSEFSAISPSEDGTVLFVATPSDLHTRTTDWIEKRNEITAITNLRVQFVRLHTFGDWKIDNSPNIRNKYYYALSEWIIRGRCSCYGHASHCRPKEGQEQRKEMVYGVCVCQHNTMGQHCQKCKDFYNDKPWQPAENNSTNQCKKCQCNRHSTSCHFDPVVYDLSGRTSGGICDSCLDNTEGKNCERCRSGYYRNSLVPLSSDDTCLKCKCDPHGTIHPNLCIQETESDLNFVAGSCMCKENVDGFYCDRCKTGFWKFDKSNEQGCTECKCLMMGTINGQGCDSVSGRCFCKSFVDGQLCNTCKEGYYNLSSSNPSGCSTCGCSEHGSLDWGRCDRFSGQCKCRPGYVGRTCDEVKDGWFIDSPNYPLRYRENIQIELPPVSKSGYYNFIITTDTEQVQVSDTFMVILSIDHNVKSSCLSYQDTISITKDSKNIVIPNKCLVEELPIIISAFVIIGPSESSRAPNVIDVIVVPMLSPSSPDTRIALAECLKYHPESVPAKCNFLKVEISSRAMSNIEPKNCMCNVTGSLNNVCNKYGGQCHCLPNVKGRQCDICDSNSYGFDARGCKSCDCDSGGSLNLQCQADTGQCLCRTGVEGRHCSHCRSGFWRFPFCEPCKCHSMSDSCDQKTGKCNNCRGNSFGFNCQQCNNGYYGDPSKNLPCLKCKCPGLLWNLNHSLKCSLIFNTSSYICVCKPGFRGQFCDECEDNYYGNPRDKNGACNKCHCSQNIDRSVSGSCDTRTGECKKCLYNTAGFNCEKCATGYFGVGVSRTCRRCVCNELGTDPKVTELCHHETGKCPCLPNVFGQQCHKCQYGYFNISSGKGCQPCECDSSNGAFNDSCNSLTGQCHCRGGKSGRQCDKCKDGYWGDPRQSDGCKVCKCDSEGSLFKQCDRNNGACRCRAGIVGRHCDKCARGTDGMMPNCSSCGECWIQWDSIIQQIIVSLGQIENGTMQNITITGLPTNLLATITSINRYLTSSQWFISHIPDDLASQLNSIQSRLEGLRMEFERLQIPYFPSSEFEASAIVTRIVNMTNLVDKNKMQNVGGAYNIIVKSLSSVRDSLNNTYLALERLQKMKTVTKSREVELEKINLEKLEMKSKRLSQFENTLSENLNKFNKLTCNAGSSSSSNPCSDVCGGVGCIPNTCSRAVKMEKQCFKVDPATFFNAHVWKINNRKSLDNYFATMDSDLRKDIRLKFTTTKSEVENPFELLGVTNKAINDKYNKALQLLENLKRTVNNYVTETEFKRILLAIRNFTLLSRKTEIENIENEINKRIGQLSDKVNNILAESNHTRTICDTLKIQALQEKSKASDLLKSITDMEYNNRLVLQMQNGTKSILLNVTFDLLEIKKLLSEIKETQKDTESEQRDIAQKGTIVNILNTTINETMLAIEMTGNSLAIDQINITARLTDIRLRYDKALTKKNSLTKTGDIIKNKNEGKRQEMLDSIKELNKKITNSREKIDGARQMLLMKTFELRALTQTVEDKVQRFSSLESEIFEKSEFQASCLP